MADAVTPRTLILGFVVIWVALYAYSFWVLTMTRPTGDGFTRGLNRVAAFFGWQFGAGAVALAMFLSRSYLNPGVLRRFLWGPLVLGLLPVGFVLTRIGWSWIQHLMFVPA